MRNTQPASVQSVDRALQILLAFEDDGGELRVTDLAEQLDVHKSTASRLAATLEAQGFLERADGAEAFRLGPRIVRLGMIAAGGRDIVGAADLPPGKLERMSPRTITSLRALEQELAEVRANGWARSVGEYEEGLNGVAAPVYDDDRCVAALSVSGPAYRVREELLPDLAARCIEAANSVGWSVYAA